MRVLIGCSVCFYYRFGVERKRRGENVEGCCLQQLYIDCDSGCYPTLCLSACNVLGGTEENMFLPLEVLVMLNFVVVMSFQFNEFL